MDFWLPPEISSARMYAGPGPESLIEASGAWQALGAELESAATAIHSTVASIPWSGPSASAMAGAVAPYVGWLQSTAVQARQMGAAASAMTGAFTAALAATIPPALVAANRARLAMLVATNIFGQNFPAIAETEMEYAEMWAGNAAAAIGYFGSHLAQTGGLPSFAAPAPVAATPAQGIIATLTAIFTSPLFQAISPGQTLLSVAFAGPPTVEAALHAEDTRLAEYHEGGLTYEEPIFKEIPVAPGTPGGFQIGPPAAGAAAEARTAGKVGPLSVPASAWATPANTTPARVTLLASETPAAAAPRTMPLAPLIGAPMQRQQDPKKRRDPDDDPRGVPVRGVVMRGHPAGG